MSYIIISPPSARVSLRVAPDAAEYDVPSDAIEPLPAKSLPLVSDVQFTIVNALPSECVITRLPLK